MTCVAFFVTSHGFGHASRACAVGQALNGIVKGIRLELFTGVPEWFFSQSLDTFGHHRLECDSGPVQKNALTTDIAGTLKILDKELPFSADRLDPLASTLHDLHCQLVVCDIAPMGIAAAQHAGLPCVLIENFTWDWIYAELALLAPEFAEFSSALTPLYETADLHIQCAPVCRTANRAKLVNPVSRPPRRTVHDTREALEIDKAQPMVLIGMGGVAQDHPYCGHLESEFGDIQFVIAGGSRAEHRLAQNVLMLPADSVHYHPDLVCAADLVIGKAGYSTIAEVFHGGSPFGYFVRDDSPEMPPLVEFLNDHVTGRALKATDYSSGKWLTHLRDLLEAGHTERPKIENGALQCARLIAEKLAR